MRLFILVYVLNSIQTSVTVSLSPEEENAIRQKLLNEHNKYRKIHQAQPLVLDDNLNNQARLCASYISGVKGPCLKPGNSFWGQNIWTTSKSNLRILLNSDLPEDDPVRNWYDESKDYPGFYQPHFPKTVDHFTQLVWRQTKQIGCGFHSDSRIYVVCYYNPSGNVVKTNLEETMKTYQMNVLPAVGESETISYSWYFLGIFTLILVVFIILWVVSSSSSEYESDSPQEYISDSPPEYE